MIHSSESTLCLLTRSDRMLLVYFTFLYILLLAPRQDLRHAGTHQATYTSVNYTEDSCFTVIFLTLDIVKIVEAPPRTFYTKFVLWFSMQIACKLRCTAARNLNHVNVLYAYLDS